MSHFTWSAFGHALKASASTLIGFAALGLFLAVALSFLWPLKYSSTMTMLVVQRSGVSSDPYAAIRSMENIGDNLSQVVYTTDFFNKVLTADPTIDKNYFYTDERQRRKQWTQMVETQVSRGTGFLHLTVYHPQKAEATKIVQAISSVLSKEGWTYVSADISVLLVDPPLESRWPVKPNILSNGFIGLIVGFVIGILYVGRRKYFRYKELFMQHN